ncbi:MAG: insulinase family protein [Planctomycetes bacterium]|nr:insulinase family protein [Planctomycetota bacterium]
MTGRPTASRRLLALLALIAAAAVCALAPRAARADDGATPAAPATAAARAATPLTLDNGIKVLVIHDPQADHAGVALAVNAGSMYDGKSPGIAHFLEHMLFLGTTKYPKSGEYSDYLTANGGSSNAYTGYDVTNYHFDVKTEALEGALDRFAQFFISPLLTDELSSREVNAVDSEHSKNLEDDFWRARQVYRSVLNPAHPECHFSTGNKQTLEGIKNEELRAFYSAHYSSNLMSLVVISSVPTPAVEAWVRRIFTPIPNQKLAKPAVTVPLFHPAIAAHQVDIQPVRDMRKLWLRFELAEADFDPQSKPTRLVGSILGHEGPESLLENLKREGLATSLSAGGNDLGNQGTFNIDLDLTESGLAHLDVVLERIFGMINYLRGLPELPDYLHDELARMAEIDLRFYEPGQALDEARTLAALMFQYPHEKLIENFTLIQKKDPATVRHVLAALTPANAFALVIAKDRPADRTEPHYGTKYGVSPMAPELVARLAKAERAGAMALPPPNPFIPSEFALVEPAAAAKPVLHAFDFGEVWLRHDVRFQQPKAALQFRIANDENAKSARDSVLGDLFAAAAGEALNPYRYPMTLAGLELGVTSSRFGLEVLAQGYSHKLPELLAFVAPYLTGVKIDEKQFAILKERATRELRNKTRQPPSRLAFDLFRETFREVHFNDAQQLAEIEKLTLADLTEYAVRIKDAIWLSGFVYGNLTAAQVQAMTADFVKRLAPARALAEKERFVPRILELKPGASLILARPIESNDSATLLLWQHDPLTPERKASLKVANEVLPNRFYQDLRTLQQTGYIVSAGAFEVENLPVFYFMSQSSVVDPASLRGRFEAFVKHAVVELRDEPAEAFEAARSAALAELLRKRKDFKEELDWHFQIAFHYRADFGIDEKDAAALKGLTREQWLADLATFFAEEGARRVSIELSGNPARFIYQDSTLEALRKGARGFRQRYDPVEGTN